MRIAIYGAGGVGGYFGARLAEFGQEVHFIARGKHLEAIKKTGLKVSSIAGDIELDSVNATDDPATIGPVDYIICTVKHWQLAAAAKAMKPMVGPDTLIIPLQNGVEAIHILSEFYDTEQILGGLCAIIAFIAEPGHIKHSGANPLIRFGRPDSKADPRINRLSEVFNRCIGVKSSIPENIHTAIWQKFILITPWSGMASVARAPIGVLLTQPEVRELIIQSMEEILAVASAIGIPLPDNIIESTLTTFDSFPVNSTSSMQRDIEAGHPSELDSLVGAVVRLGKENQVATPLNTFILNSLRSQELRSRGALKF